MTCSEMATHVLKTLSARDYPLMAPVRAIVVVLVAGTNAALVTAAAPAPSAGLLAILVLDWIAAFLFLLQPLPGAALLTLSWAAATLLPTTSPLLLVPVGMMAIFLLALHDWRVGVATGLSCTGFAILFPWSGLSGTGVDMLRSAAGLCAMAACAAGSGDTLARWLRQRRRRRQHVVSRTLRDATVPLHDVTCNNLCYALRRVQGLTAHDTDQAAALADIAAALEESLRTARQSMGDVRAISSFDDDGRPSAGGTVLLDLGALVERCRRRLDSLGVKGTIIVEPDCARLGMASDLADVVRGLVRELFGNALKYAQEKDGYCLTCAVESGILRVTWCDVPRQDAEHGTATGLLHYTQGVESRGGHVEVGSDEGLWTFTAALPLDGSTDSRDGRSGRHGHAGPAVFVASAMTWTLMALVCAAAELLLAGVWGLSLAVGLCYLAIPLAALLLGMVSAVRHGTHAWWTVPMAMLGGAISVMMLGTTVDTLPLVALFGCILGGVPALVGVALPMAVRALLRLARRGTRQPQGFALLAAVMWAMLACVAAFILLLQPASTMGVPWASSVLSAASMAAVACTVLARQ